MRKALEKAGVKFIDGGLGCVRSIAGRFRGVMFWQFRLDLVCWKNLTAPTRSAVAPCYRCQRENCAIALLLTMGHVQTDF